AFYVGSNNKAYFSKHGLKPNQLSFAPHAIDNIRFSQLRNSEVAQLRHDIGISDHDILILFAGKFEEKKNPMALLDAFIKLKQKDVHLLFVGNGILEANLKEKVKSTKSKNVHFLPFQNQQRIPVIYQACDLFCLPSKGPGETWGLAVNEAMAAGKAILVSKNAGAAVDLVDNTNGGIFDSTVADLERKLTTLVESKSNLRALGKVSSANVSKEKILLPIYAPVLLSYVFQFNPVASYFIAWLGSFAIYYWTILSPIKYIQLDLPLSKQIMRPIVLTQLVFAGFMCSTSIFYFIDHLGYQYFSKINNQIFIANDLTENIAACQRYCLVAHAALVTGIISATKLDLKIKYIFKVDTDKILIQICGYSYLLGIIFSRISAVVQFSYMFIFISLFAGSLTFVKGIVKKRPNLVAIGGGVFLFNLVAATLSGYKESVINNLLILVFLLFPYYRKLILITSIPLICVLLYILPTLANTIRGQAWSGEATAEEARDDAYDALTNDDNSSEIHETNWQFLTNRLSEINMFTQYVEHVPAIHPYYGFEILGDSFYALIPRFLWPGKPNTEKLSMERVYEANVANRLSSVSAKTRPVVDGYLSAGLFGVFISMLIYGYLTQWLCNQAESLFGGYEMGCIILFNGIFQQLWRGNNWEFLLNNILYGYVLLIVIFTMLKQKNILVKTLPDEEHTNQSFL
ncbi:MAG: glycosyltransferase, partial [Pedobacter sp.]